MSTLLVIELEVMDRAVAHAPRIVPSPTTGTRSQAWVYGPPVFDASAVRSGTTYRSVTGRTPVESAGGWVGREPRRTPGPLGHTVIFRPTIVCLTEIPDGIR